MFFSAGIPFILAAAWHLGDALIMFTPQKRKARALWVGVGVGWSLFWLVRHFTKKQPLIETNYDKATKCAKDLPGWKGKA